MLRSKKMLIRKAAIKDAAAIAKIYNYYIKHTPITFEIKTIKTAEIAKRMKGHSKKYIWLVGVVDGVIIGYAYSSEFQERAAYKHSQELTVYLHKDHFGKGYGTLLYKKLIALVKKTDCAVMIGGIGLPNKGSVRLHEKLGFKKVAHFKKVGRKFGKWIDVGYWEKVLRRSSV